MGLFSKHLSSIHVEHYKNTAGYVSEVMPIPEKVFISMSQHIGAPCKPVVQKGDYVKVGQLIGDTDAFISAPIHASVSGEVVGIEQDRSNTGGKDTYIVIASDGKQEPWEGLAVPQCDTLADFIKAIRSSGLVGLGGATFPTHVKFNPKNIDEIDTLVVNGAECEPFLTSDYRNMIECTDDIVSGIKLVMKYLGLTKCYVGIENNKPDGIATISEALKDVPGASVVELQSSYPQGAERVLLYETTGNLIPAGVLPASVGCILSNISSIMFVGQYFRTGMPLVSKKLTIDGNAVTEPKNVVAPIGAKVYDVINYCGGYKSTPKKILFGGPMMGKALYNDGAVLVKSSNSILVFDNQQAVLPEPAVCINCGRCHRACPIDLMPTWYYKAYNANNAQRLADLQITQCMECGSCSYVCPAKLPLAFTHKLAKALVKEAGL